MKYYITFSKVPSEEPSTTIEVTGIGFELVKELLDVSLTPDWESD